MEFRETLLAAQRNQQQKSSRTTYYRTGFDPPKKEQRKTDKLSENILKFLAKKDEEEKEKQMEEKRKRDELLAMRDPKALRKIQKTLKTIKSANKSVIEDAVDHNNTAFTREGDQPDQDDYGYESQEAAAIYEKMMQKYSKIPDEPKFPVGKKSVKKDLKGTMERVKNALAHEDDPVPHKRRRRTENGERESSPPQKYEPEKKKDEKPEKPKFRKPAPPPMDFNQLLKLAEEKKSAPVEVAPKPVVNKPAEGPDRPMTKKQRREYEEEMARRQRRLERLEADKHGRKPQRDERSERPERPADREKKPESTGFGRIPKIGDKSAGSTSNHHKTDSPKIQERSKDRPASDRERMEKMQKEKDRVRQDRVRAETEKERLDRERLEKLKAERERIDREMERLNRDRDRIDKTKIKLESSKSDRTGKDVDRSKPSPRDQASRQDSKKSIDLKSQNTYRIDKSSNDRKFSIPKNGDSKYMNGHSSQSKVPPKGREQEAQRSDRERMMLAKQKALQENGKRLPENGKGPTKRPDERPAPASKPQAAPSKPKISNSFDFDKHVTSLGKGAARPPDRNGKRPDAGRALPPADARRKMQADEIRRKQKRRAIDSESEYDSEMDDFIDDGDENMDYSSHIKEIFGYDKSKYRDIDDGDDPSMESSFARQQREEYISKKLGIMEDLEDMRMEAMEKKKASKKKRRISDD